MLSCTSYASKHFKMATSFFHKNGQNFSNKKTSDLGKKIYIDQKNFIEKTLGTNPLIFFNIKSLNYTSKVSFSSVSKLNSSAIFVAPIAICKTFKELIEVRFTVYPNNEPIKFSLISPIPNSFHKNSIEVEKEVLSKAKKDNLYREKEFSFLKDTVITGLTGICYPNNISKKELYATTLCMAHLFKNDDYCDENGDIDPYKLSIDMERKKEVLKTGKLNLKDNKTTEYMLMLSKEYPGIFKNELYEKEYFRYLQNTCIESTLKGTKEKINQKTIDLIRPLASGAHLALAIGVCVGGIDISKVYSFYPEIETMWLMTSICIGKGNDLVSNKEIRRVLNKEESMKNSLNSVIHAFENTKSLQKSYQSVADQFNKLVKEIYKMKYSVEGRLSLELDKELKKNVYFILNMLDRWLAHQTTWSPFVPRYNRELNLSSDETFKRMMHFIVESSKIKEIL